MYGHLRRDSPTPLLSIPPRYVVPVSDPERSYCIWDELARAATLRVASCLHVTLGGRALVFWTQYDSVGHRARLRGTARYARGVNHIRERNCYGIGACNGDEVTRAATVRTVSRLPVPSGGRALVFWTPYNSVDHRARLSGTNRYARAVDHIGERNCDGIGAWRYSPGVRLSPETFVCS